jgi:DnaJ-class molecular chaperone
MEHYQTLGIDIGASPDEIKKAYRKLASQHHPDKGGDTATFQKIQTAYDTLSDPEKRQQYDNPIQQGFPGQGFHFNMNGFNMDDIFGQMFRQHQQQQQRQQQLYRTIVWINLEQVYSGGEQILRLQTPIGNHVIKIDIPKGIPDGAQIRYENIVEGGALMVEFRIHNHLKFERRMNDLYSNHPISVLDLIAGLTVEFVTIGGKNLEVTIPSKTQPYMHIKLVGHGLPIQNTNSYGDQILLLKPFIPDTIDSDIIDSILLSRTK